ncbi:hypothetical protein [Ostreiculturibacter nitratireducens]|uniref:hypothetical protein n=1 Tax=Ostreiculturibacter nitratireducens TaxID=3075226 RepID=UPI0031B5E8EF
MKDVANRRHDTADWDGVFDRDGTVYWTGAPDRTRLVLTKYGLAASALFLGGPFVAAGGMQAAVSVIVTFFALRALWLHLLRVSETRYAVSDRHIAIRRFGHGAGWLKYPSSDYFLQNDNGQVRVFARLHVPRSAHGPVARLPYLPSRERTAALRAAGRVPHHHFHVPRHMAGMDIEVLLPYLLARAGIEEAEMPPLLWQGRPDSAPMMVPWLFPGAVAIVLFGAALAAAVAGHVQSAIWAGAGSLLAALIEIGVFRLQDRRATAVRYALAGRYAIRIGPGVPFLTGLCEIQRISPTAPISADATDVIYGEEAIRIRGAWVTARVTFHKPPDAARLLGLLRDAAASDPDRGSSGQRREPEAAVPFGT